MSTEEKRLLIVDDDPAVLKLLKTLLSRARYGVSGCQSGPEALKLLSQHRYDLMITDAIMPVMSGFDLVRAIRDNPSFEQLPILMLTRKNERSDVKKALDAGVTDYVLKPIDEHLLYDKVEVLLRAGEPANRLRELPIHGEMSEATATIDIQVVSMRETGIVIRFPFQIPPNRAFRLNAPIFERIGISPPILRMISCKPSPSANPDGEVELLRDFPWEAEFGFLGLREPELRKIRSWLQSQEIQRKK